LEPRPRKVQIHIAPNGERPFVKFLDELEHLAIHGYLLTRIARVRQGLFGDWKPVGQGVGELRVHMGAGYRMYFGVDGDTVVMLCGGTKKRQNQDIARALSYWSDYRAQKN
jgi:putative addiction module killer protein